MEEPAKNQEKNYSRWHVMLGALFVVILIAIPAPSYINQTDETCLKAVPHHLHLIAPVKQQVESYWHENGGFPTGTDTSSFEIPELPEGSMASVEDGGIIKIVLGGECEQLREKEIRFKPEVKDISFHWECMSDTTTCTYFTN
ncbi:MAG: pilin [Sedimenticola sp.]